MISEESQGGVFFFGGILVLFLFFWLFSLEDKSIGTGALILTVLFVIWIGWNDQQKKAKRAQAHKFEVSRRKSVEEALIAKEIMVDGKQVDLEKLFQMAIEYGYKGDIMGYKGGGGISMSKGMVSTFNGAIDTLRKNGHTVEVDGQVASMAVKV